MGAGGEENQTKQTHDGKILMTKLNYPDTAETIKGLHLEVKKQHLKEFLLFVSHSGISV